MKGYGLIPVHSPVIAAPVHRCKAPADSHMYRCYMRWLAYQTCVFVLMQFVSVCSV